jgi:hypothetical protein
MVPCNILVDRDRAFKHFGVEPAVRVVEEVAIHGRNSTKMQMLATRLDAG